MKKELPKVYEPREVEGRVYEMWEKNGCFEGHRDPDKRPFTIVMPPPTSPASSTWATPWTAPSRTS